MNMLEGILQGLLSWLLAVPLSLGLARLLANRLGQIMFDANLDYQYNTGAVLAWLVSARNATQISIRESLTYI